MVSSKLNNEHQQMHLPLTHLVESWKIMQPTPSQSEQPSTQKNTIPTKTAKPLENINPRCCVQYVTNQKAQHNSCKTVKLCKEQDKIFAKNQSVPQPVQRRKTNCVHCTNGPATFPHNCNIVPPPNPRTPPSSCGVLFP